MEKLLFDYLYNHKNNVSVPKKLHKKNGLFPYNYFIADSIYEEAKKHTNVTQFTWTVYGNSDVRCALNVYSMEEEYPEDKMNYLMQCISFILSFAKENHPLTVHFVPLNHKKCIRKNQYRIGKSNVNSGACGGGQVYVWRLEECFKVLLHECIHHLGFSNLQLSDELLTHYQNKYNLCSSSINHNESYTEIWARILYCYYLSKQSFPAFQTALAIEKDFSLYQANKVIQLSQNNNLDKDTNVTAYYIITAELMQQLNQFLHLCFQNNDSIFYVLDQNLVDQFMIHLQKLREKKINTKDSNYTTMRMVKQEL